MSQLILPVSLLFGVTCINFSIKASSWFRSAERESLPAHVDVKNQSGPERAIVDPRALQRQKAFELLKQHPKLVQYLQENKDTLGLASPKPTETVSIAPTPQQTPVVVREFINTIKQDQEKNPQRPLIVSVNVNNQSLSSELNSVHANESPPPNPPDPPDDQSIFDLYVSPAMQWIYANKGYCLWYCLIGSWAGAQLYLFLIRRYLNGQDSWACWKKHLALEELYRMTTNTLVKEILKSKAVHSGEQAQSTACTTLKQCIKEVENELSTLSSYRRFLSLVKAVPLCYMFLFKGTLLEEVIERIQRLMYIKNVLLSFLEEYAFADKQKQLAAPQQAALAP